MEYVVIEGFKDGQDNEKEYKAEERYPRPANKKIKADRLAELAGHDNDQGRPFIRVKEEDKKASPEAKE